MAVAENNGHLTIKLSELKDDFTPELSQYAGKTCKLSDIIGKVPRHYIKHVIERNPEKIHTWILNYLRYRERVRAKEINFEINRVMNVDRDRIYSHITRLKEMGLVEKEHKENNEVWVSLKK